MKLIWVLAFAAGGMSTTVDDDGWVTQTAPVQGEACVRQGGHAAEHVKSSGWSGIVG